MRSQDNKHPKMTLNKCFFFPSYFLKTVGIRGNVLCRCLRVFQGLNQTFTMMGGRGPENFRGVQSIPALHRQLQYKVLFHAGADSGEGDPGTLPYFCSNRVPDYLNPKCSYFLKSISPSPIKSFPVMGGGLKGD